MAPAEIDGLAAALAGSGRSSTPPPALAATRIAGARELLGRLEAAERAAAAARDELRPRSPTPPPPPAPLDPRLGAELARIAATGRRRATWPDGPAPGSSGWTPRAAARGWPRPSGRSRANRAPIEARNQLRGLLDAYEVKASRLGLGRGSRA